MNRRNFLQTTAATLLLSQIVDRPIVAAPRPRKLALLVGINDYSQGQSSEAASLQGCINDVALLKNLLIYRYGFEPENVLTLTDAQATREAILKTIETHLLTANPEDTVVFSFSGHGTPLEDPYEKGTKTTAILPYNHSIAKSGKTNFITGTTLFLLRSAFKTNQVTFILDCCYAGGGIRGDVRIRSTEPPIGNLFYPNTEELQYQQQWLKRLNLTQSQLKQYRKIQQGTKGILLSAANENQTAQDASFNYEYNAGAFTKFFTEALWNNADRSLKTIETTVRQSLINLAIYPENAQEPVFTYPHNQQQSLQNQTAFFTPANLAAIPLQGMVLKRDRRQVTLWLGGLTPRHLSIGSGAEFRLVTSQDLQSAPIARLTDKIADDFTTIVTIPPGTPLPKPGTLLQQYYRPIPQDLKLKIGLDSSLGQSIQFPNYGSRIQSIHRQADGLFGGVDFILSKMTSEYQKLQSNPALPAIDTYGLFSSQLNVIPNSFGPKNESLDQAFDRLRPLLHIHFIQKLLGSIVATDQEIKDLKTVEAKVYLKDNPDNIISIPNQAKQAIQVGQKVEVQLSHNTKKDLEALLVGISPAGKMTHRYYPDGMFKQVVTIDPEDAIGSYGEFLILLSATRLDTIDQQLTELSNELTRTSRTQDDRCRDCKDQDLPITQILNELRRPNRKTDTISQVVLSLPIHVKI
jgi:hypothetical protein